MRADVLVAGGGTAGVIAAIQAARTGVKVVLIEMMGQLGGTMTGGGVSAPAYFWSRYQQIIAGIGWEIVEKCQINGGAHIPDFKVENPNRPSYHVGINQYLWAAISEETAIQAGVDIHYHEVITSVKDTCAGEWIVKTAGKNCCNEFTVKEIIDCTGDANIVAMLGYPVVMQEDRQPGTLEFKISGYDAATMDAEAIEIEYKKALADGRLQLGDFAYKNQPFINFLNRGGQNLQHTFGIDASTSIGMTQASIAGRQALLRLLRFIRTLPGGENAKIENMADYATTRDSYRIIGEKTITYDDYRTGVDYPDAVAYTLYFIDVHNEEGTHHEFLPFDVIPKIPLGALIPAGSSRLITAGRMISSDKLAHSALRVEASCMAMGQAAGAAAAIGIQMGIPSREVPIERIKDLLKEHGAIVPGL
jgi:hypothetical protein